MKKRRLGFSLPKRSTVELNTVHRRNLRQIFFFIFHLFEEGEEENEISNWNSAEGKPYTTFDTILQL